MEHCKNSNFISQKATAKPTDPAVNESKLRVTDSLAFANNPHISGSSWCALYHGHIVGDDNESNILLRLAGEFAHVAMHT